MLCTEIIAVCSEIYTKHINALCGQNVELFMLILAVRMLPMGFKRLKKLHCIKDKTLSLYAL